MRSGATLCAILAIGVSMTTGCDGGSGQPCASDRMCSASAQVCDGTRGVCVDCNVDGDCIGVDEVCRANMCVAVTPCTSSRECPGLVCDRDRGYCVECVTDVDCPGDEVCDRDGVCEPPPTVCTSDRHCADEGRVCDTVAMVCVDCVRDADCDAELVCRESVCQRGATDTGVPADAGPDGSSDGGLDATTDGGVDSGRADAGMDAAPDSGFDSGTADSGAADTGTTDSGTADSGAADSGTADTGVCDAACLCARAATEGSSAGCEFWPTVTPTSTLVPDHNFGVEITNGESVTANINVFRGVSLVASIAVPGGDSRPLALPRISELDFSASRTNSVRVAVGAYRLVSTSPVRVRQMSALASELTVDCASDTDMDGLCPAFSTDGTTLLPTHRLGNAYTILSRPPLMIETMDIFLPVTTVYPGFAAVVATQPTTVNVTDSTANIVASADGTTVPAIGVGGSASISMGRGDVLVLIGAHESPCAAGSPVSVDGMTTFCVQSSATDLTGTRISASQPLQVIGGHDCGFVPFDEYACDHLESSLLPDADHGPQLHRHARNGVERRAHGGPRGRDARLHHEHQHRAADRGSVLAHPRSVRRARGLPTGRAHREPPLRSRDVPRGRQPRHVLDRG